MKKKDLSEKLFHSLLPVKRSESKKVLVLGILKLLSSFLFTLLKVHKDNNIVSPFGSEKVPYTKVIVFFFALLASILYTSASNKLRINQLLYSILGILLVFFCIYTFILIPYKKVLTPDITALLAKYEGKSTFFENMSYMYKGWFKVFFYTIAELFGQFCIVIFFWSIANELFDRNAAKRIYPIFIALGAIGGIFGVLLETTLCNSAQSKYGTNDNEAIVTEVSKQIGYLGILVLVLMLLVFRWINGTFLEEKRKEGLLDNEKFDKVKISFWQGFKHIARNPYLLATTLMIVSCAVACSLSDITYKAYLKKTGDLPSNYAGQEQKRMIIGLILSCLGSLFLAPWLMRKISWKVTAYVAPVVVMLSGTLFFFGSWFKESTAVQGIASWFSLSNLQFITILGLYQSAIVTFVRYVFFDGCKEIVFAGLNPISRRKSKAAIDVVGSRSGKALSSTIHMALLSLFSLNNDVSEISHLLLGVFLLFCISWFWSIHFLSKDMGTSEKETVKGINDEQK